MTPAHPWSRAAVARILAALALALLLASGRGWTEEATSGAPVFRDGADVRGTLDRVLASPDFRRLARSRDDAMQRGYDFGEWLEWLFGSDRSSQESGGWAASGAFLRILLYVVVVLAVVVVLGLILRATFGGEPATAPPSWSGQSDGSAFAASTPPGEYPADEYLRRAIELGRSGDYRSAVRQVLLGSMSWIERRELIRYRRGLTNRDYIRAVWRHEACRDSLVEIVDVFDRVFFGRRPATSRELESCLTKYREGFSGGGDDGKAPLAS